MTITFYSNFLNHHQLPFSEAMYKRQGDSYRFVATTPIDKDRLDMGYHDINELYPYVLTTYDSEANAKEAMKLALTSDVIITGSAPEMYTRERIKLNKLTFRYSERIYKRGLWRVPIPIGLSFMLMHHTRYRNKNLYMLCASAYAAGDFALVGAYNNKTFKWGYFPKVIKYDIQELLASKNRDTIEILWVGRLLGYKHPEKAIHVAKQLKNDGYNFEMNIIGIGEEENNINKLVDKYSLNTYVRVLGAMSPEKVREHMERANIFLFTSNYQEGWGAVLNESMNSGCAIVASHAAGAVPFMIRKGENGLVYKNNSDEDLYTQVKKLMDNRSLREELGYNAYYTMLNTWNAETATENFLQLCEGLLYGKKAEIPEGPCSIAGPIPQRRMYELT